MNSISNDTLDEKIDRYRFDYLFYQYIGAGSASLLVNIWICAVLCYDKKIRLKSQLLLAMTSANILRSLHGVCTGSIRLIKSRNGSIRDLTSTFDCMLTVQPSLMILGLALTPTVHLAVGAERLAAIAAPNWYRIYGTPKLANRVFIFIYFIVFLVWLTPAWIISLAKPRWITADCNVTKVVSLTYLVAIGVTASFCSVAAVVVNVGALVVGNKKLGRTRLSTNANRKDVQWLRKRIQYARMTLILAIFDVIFSTAPNWILPLHESGRVRFPETVGSFGVFAHLIVSVSNAVTYSIFNRHFRYIATEICFRLRHVNVI